MKKIILLSFLYLGLSYGNTLYSQVVCPIISQQSAISEGTSNPTTGTCDVPNQTANNDAQVAFTDIVEATKAEKWEGTTYAGGDFATATGTVSGGAVTFSGLKHNTTYSFRFWSTFDGCYKDVSITTPSKNCIAPCTLPLVDNTPVLGTCNGAVANDDAAIHFTNIANADKVEKWEGDTYGGPDYITSTSTVTGATMNFIGLKHNTTYTFRFWNGNKLCYTDVIRTTPLNTCSTDKPIFCVTLVNGPLCCPTKICLPVKITRN